MDIMATAYCIIAEFKQQGLGMQGNNAYNIGRHNVGGDVVQAAEYAAALVRNAHANSPSPLSLPSLADVLEQQLDAYDKNEYDPEGYGCGTLREIINKLRAQAGHQIE